MLKRPTLIAAMILMPAGLAGAQIVVLGDGDARACYLAAETGDQAGGSAERTCRSALASTSLPGPDRTATAVNLGILLMRHGDHEAALEAFDMALTMRPGMNEALINRGASLIHLHRYDDAIAALTLAIDQGGPHQGEALFNRALAHDFSADYAAARLDLLRVVELRPDWDAPARMLDRYTVTRQPPEG